MSCSAVKQVVSAASVADACARLAPDVVVTDVRMPPTGTDEGIRLAAELRERHPGIGVVVLSKYAEPGYALAILSTTALAKSTAPFSDAANAIFGGAWAGDVMSIAVIVSGLGALVGWTMICAEMPLAAVKDGLFPARFKRMNHAEVPAFGIVASTTLASIAMVINYLGSNGATVFTTLVLMTGITAAIPYGFSALAQIKWRWIDHKAVEAPRFARDMIIAVLAVVFSVLFIWYSRNTGHSFFVYWAPFLMAGGALLLGIPVYRSRHGRMARPAAVPPYPEVQS